MTEKKQNPTGSNGQDTSQAALGETRIALVLDRSGSMDVIREQARQAFNEAIERVTEEARKKADARLTVLTFNQEVTPVVENAPIHRVRKLEPADYRPDGCTALFDAVGQAIDTLGEPGPLNENDAALVVVVTDGHENSSRKVSHSDLVERMQALKATGAWTFSFMCAEVDITELSKRLNLDQQAFAAYSRTSKGATEMGLEVSQALGGYFDGRRAGKRQRKDFWKKG